MTALRVTSEDITSLTDDKRIESVDEIISPRELIDIYPVDEKTSGFIELSRKSISNIINLNDSRLLIITGPCSIHNSDEAIEYAEKLLKIKENNPHLFLVMRTYFEKPRTTVGWKGLINDPDRDDSCDIEKGLEIARDLLLKINQMGIPTAVEFLDTITPQYIADLVSWGAIGARTTESQEHRKLVSGLSMPIGFKNGTSGDIQIAIDAIKSSVGKHTFLSVAKDGKVAKITTTGNSDSHIILRGGSTGPNYSESHIEEIDEKLQKNGIESGIIVDFSHANSSKDYRNQTKVCSDVAEQIKKGNDKIVGVMIEGNLNAGNQKLSDNLLPGISITDACVDWRTNNSMFSELNIATGIRNSGK
ncbi:MAG: 3-deoxy-7-phosphoheptulonate synthase [Candidatus Gracilibacteria bacterium]|nr:3-deoxy-7-phosphoheptulonate synthase [Candidatus Gracilibacteria bacterium]MDD2908864.1 3-deoxy-7-phosphoheptulonate synthase [Candidatus Gracilibacteria bacterium]